jgi:hypothetical protein
MREHADVQPGFFINSSTAHSAGYFVEGQGVLREFVVQFEPFWGLCTEGKRSQLPQTHAPCPLRCVAIITVDPLRLRLRRGSEAPGDPEAAARGMEGIAAYDVLQTGSGTAQSKVVTRCNSALTGQELGRWRRILSLYCLICVAILKRVRMTVEGCA